MLLRLRYDSRLLEEAEFRQLFTDKPVPEVITKEVANSYGADIVTVNPEPTPVPFCRITSEVIMDEMGCWRKVWSVTEVADPEERATFQIEFEKQLTKDVKAAVQAMLDEEAQKRDYDTIHTAALRAGYPGPFHEEGVQYAMWMDACWDKCHDILKKVKASERPIPTSKEVVAEMPSFSSYEAIAL